MCSEKPLNMACIPFPKVNFILIDLKPLGASSYCCQPLPDLLTPWPLMTLLPFSFAKGGLQRFATLKTTWNWVLQGNLLHFHIAELCFLCCQPNMAETHCFPERWHSPLRLCALQCLLLSLILAPCPVLVFLSSCPHWPCPAGPQQIVLSLGLQWL